MSLEAEMWTDPVYSLTEKERQRRHKLTREIAVEVLQINYFRPKIIEAYLFGSNLSGSPKTDSDVDIGLITNLELSYRSILTVNIEQEFYRSFYTRLRKRKEVDFTIHPTLIALNWLQDPNILPEIQELVKNIKSGEKIK